MPLAMWAKTAAGTNLAFIKGFGKAMKKSCREILEAVIQRKVAPRARTTQQQQPVGVGADQPQGWSAWQQHTYLQRPVVYTRTDAASIQSRIFQSLLSRTFSKSMSSELRRRSALLGGCLSSSSSWSRRIPIMSLVGLTLALDVSTFVDDTSEKMMSQMRDKFRGYSWQIEPLEKLPQSLSDLDISLESIASGCEGAVYKAKVKADTAELTSTSPFYSTPELTNNSASIDTVKDDEYNLAVKVVFNYGAESDSYSILRALERETVPLRAEGCQIYSTMWNRMTQLPPHPNIVDMPGMFVDDMLVTEEGLQKFPAAMPCKLNPELHYGRNKTMYLVMRRRSTHLRNYLASHDITMETRCLILAQLLEGVAHMGLNGIAHRDLKSDNVLVDVPTAGGVPRLEICDFGCCLAEENKSLTVPYPTRDIYIGGNSWLMAPELVTAAPGLDSILDFSKSDLWAAGTIAYEILGGENPFYPSKVNSHLQLSSKNYNEEELPALPVNVPVPVQRLVKSLLARDPKKRPSPSVAASVVQMVVLEGSGSQKQRNHADVLKVMSRKQKLNGKRLNPVSVALRKEKQKFMWLMVHSLSMLCRLIFGNQSEGWDMKFVMNFLLLSRLNYADFKEALKFL